MNRESPFGPRPLSFLVVLWAVVLLLSFYGAGVLQTDAEGNEALAEQGWLQSGLSEWTALSEASGMGAVAGALNSLRERVNAPYLVFKSEEEAPAPPAQTEEPAPAQKTEDGLSEQVAKRKLRVLVIGASSIQFAVGVRLERMMGSYYEGVKVKRFGKLATGLSRPDFMNWPKKLRTLAAEFHPDLVICNFGGNDAQPIKLSGGKKAHYGKKSWDKAYAEKVTEIIDIAREYGADTVMLGMPIMRSGKFSRKMRHLNRVMKAATEAAGGQFVDTWVMASTPSGKYRKKLSWYGKKGLMRTADGVHYRMLGARYVVDHSMRQVERRFTLVPVGKGVAEHRWYTGAGGQRFGAVLYHPNQGEGPWPTVVVFPKESGGWDAWDRHPHRPLQRFVQKTGQAVLLPDPGQSDEAWAWFDKAVLPKLSQLSPVKPGPLMAVGAGRGAERLRGLLGRKRRLFSAVSVEDGALRKKRVKALAKKQLRLQITAGEAGLHKALKGGAHAYVAEPAGWPKGLIEAIRWVTQTEGAPPPAEP